MDRRGFLRGMLVLGVAPAIVRAEILMPCRSIILPPPELSEAALEELMNQLWAKHPHNLWPGVKAFWGKQYAQGFRPYSELLFEPYPGVYLP